MENYVLFLPCRREFSIPLQSGKCPVDRTRCMSIYLMRHSRCDRRSLGSFRMTSFVRLKNDYATNLLSARGIRSANSPNRKASLRRPGLSFEILEPRALLTVTITVNDPIDQLDNPTNATPASLGSTVSLRDAINAANRAHSGLSTQLRLSR